MPTMMPAAQASAPPSSQVARITRRRRRRRRAASVGFSLTARIERPTVVRVMSRNMPATRTSGERERQELVGRDPHARRRAASRSGCRG